MARYTGPDCRLCRQVGEKLFLKGERCLTPRCAIERRRRPPGQQMPRRRRRSDWAIQLREKQKARNIYGVLERQFRRYFDEALRRPGVTGQNLLQTLERRLDNVVYRLGFAQSRDQARQIIRHGHITVSGRKMDIPSYLIRPGNAVGWRESSRGKEFIKEIMESNLRQATPPWLSVDRATLSGQMLRPPDPAEIDTLVETRLIVEHYSH